MKPNGFVKAVTTAIERDLRDSSWSMRYWHGERYSWCEKRKNVFMGAVHKGPEYDDYVRFLVLTELSERRKGNNYG